MSGQEGSNLTVPVYTVISVKDEAGGSMRHYHISKVGADGEPDGPVGRFARIEFQHGPVGEVGVNGCTMEDLLGIVMHRLSAFQAGQHACHENAMAMEHVNAALMHLMHRTQRRMALGIEGTSAPDGQTGANLSALASQPAH